MIAPSGLVTSIRTWPFSVQQHARRNAMIASTALAQRRAEFEDVEEFFATRVRNTEAAVSAEAADG